MGSDIEASLKKWAEQALEGIGIDKNRFHNFAELQRKAIKGLQATYSPVVIDFALEPRNMKILTDHDAYAKVTGSCRDTIEIYLKVKEGRIVDASFQTDGCLTSIASGGMATELAKGKSLSEAGKISQETILKALGGLPEASTHCALLASDTLKQAIENFSNVNSGVKQNTKKHG